jgi:hypothetical protein
MTHTGSRFYHRDSGIPTDKINQSFSPAGNQQVHIPPCIQQLGSRLTVGRKQDNQIGIQPLLYQYRMNDRHDSPVGTVGIASPFQQASISRLETEREDIQRDVGSCFVYNTDNAERHTDLRQLHAVGTERFAQYPSYRRRKPRHTANAFSNAVDTFRRQLQPVILRVRLIHPCQVLGILRQYLSGLRFRGIRHGTQYFIYLFLPTKSQTLAGFPHLLKSICQFSHCSQID